MNLRANMMGDKANDALAIGGREKDAAIGDACREPIDPEAAVGIEHDFDDGSVGEPFRDGASERCPEHARTA